MTNTLQYPHHYGRSRWVGRAIMPENFGPLGHLITVTAVFIQNLTVIGRCSNSTLTELFCRLHFPNVKGLEIPASLFEVMSSVQVPALTHLRVTADMADHDPSYRFLKLQQGFTAYQSLTHLYITYGRVNGFGVTIEDQLFWIRTGSAVRAVALEVNDGDRLAYPPNELWKYDVHPKLVFIVHRDWEDVAIDPADFVWGSFELLDGEEDWRLPYVKAMVVVTDENEKDVWSAIDDCIAERWKEFEVEYTAAEKREILDAPELLLFGWRGSRMH
ncbi:hypothetical protein MPER_09518 [Moniliophthora perniciosa FA553]|nr:hypothetical protein MPER_09518 [Moniliophthora perniciosa FA553]